MDEQTFGTLAGLLYGELRSPLSSITGYAELLLRGDPGALTEHQTEIVQTIQRVGRRSFRITHDLYQVMLLRAGDTVLNCHDLDLNVHLDRILAHAQRAFAAAGTTLVFDRSDAAAVIHADPTFIDLMLDHLVWDMGIVPTTSVHIHTSHHDGDVWIAINAGYAGQDTMWPAPLIAWMVESIVTGHKGSIEGGKNREFSIRFPGRMPEEA
jgi:signal transduction histidine kinase